MEIIVLGPIDFCTFKASKWELDVAQPQLSTTTFFMPCVKLVYSCDKVVTRLLQGCYKVVTRLLQGYEKCKIKDL